MIYYLVQAYKKEVDNQYQRHLYPSYLTSYKMNKGGDGFGLQSGMADALKFLDEKVAEEWKEIAERTYPDREFDVVPFDGRVFGRVEPRFVVTDNFVGLYGHRHESPAKYDEMIMSEVECKPKTIYDIEARAAEIRKIVDGVCANSYKVQTTADEVVVKK